MSCEVGPLYAQIYHSMQIVADATLSTVAATYPYCYCPQHVLGGKDKALWMIATSPHDL